MQRSDRACLAQQGFRIQSADGANVAPLRGVLHFDGRYFPDDVTPTTAGTWILRRVRPTLEGTFNNIYDFSKASAWGVDVNWYLTQNFK
jgi:hypothetical protein